MSARTLTPGVAAQLRENHKISQIVKDIQRQDDIREAEREDGGGGFCVMVAVALVGCISFIAFLVHLFSKAA